MGAAQGPNDPLPDGPGKAIIVRACTGCHDASQIVYKHRAPEDWQDLIGKMIDNGAQLTPEEQDAVYAYLTKNYGSKPPADAPPVPSPSPGPSPGR